MNTIVSIDLETTGLDSNKDAIIEIGAVKFTDRRVEHLPLLEPGTGFEPAKTWVAFTGHLP